ncbi:MAG: hypothetical protein WCQ50_10250 [Spirochaetota bacterium]
MTRPLQVAIAAAETLVIAAIVAFLASKGYVVGAVLVAVAGVIEVIVFIGSWNGRLGRRG